MKLFTLVNSGIEEISKQEIKELVSSSATINPQVLEFEVKKKEEILKLIYHAQSVRRVVFSLGKFKKIEEVKFENADLQDFFTAELSFKVEVEGVKGQENRIEIAKTVAGKIFTELEKLKITPKLEMKKPDFFVNVYFNGKEYFVGIDLTGVELNSRHYRVFPHSASFKGDLTYFFVRKSGFNKGNKLLVGFAKDGATAIEAALYASGLPVQKSKEFSLFKFQLFKGLDIPKIDSKESNVFAFDETQQNFTACRKNVQLAGVKATVNKFSLDELDVKFGKNEFDNLIFQITTKDEDKLNEIYYQASYVLKKKGKLMLIGRKDWDVSISDKFNLVEEGEIHKGESIYKYLVLELK